MYLDCDSGVIASRRRVLKLITLACTIEVRRELIYESYPCHFANAPVRFQQPKASRSFIFVFPNSWFDS